MEKYMQRCDATGKGINEGYVVGDGELYFASRDNLISHLRELNWIDCNGVRSVDIETDDELMEYFYNEEYYYYTEWDEEPSVEICDMYYDADGNEYEFNN